MGLDEDIRRASIHTVGFSMVDADGAVLGSQRADESNGDGRLAEIEILRGDLAGVLHDATAPDVEYVFGDRVTGLQETPDGVMVTFAHAAPRRVDLLIGADGVHSGVRSLAFGDDPGTVRHLGVYVAYWSAPNHLGLRDWALAHEGPELSAGIRPVHGNREAIVYLSFRSPELAVDHRDVAAQKQLLRERAAGMGWEVPVLLAGLDDAPDFYFDSCSQVVLESWHRGRVGLLGDAAFSPSPLTGQGTSLALVGAYVLAGELAAAGPDLGAGLAAVRAPDARVGGADAADGPRGRGRRDAAGAGQRLRAARLPRPAGRLARRVRHRWSSPVHPEPAGRRCASRSGPSGRPGWCSPWPRRCARPSRWPCPPG